jgi:archaellin
MFIMIILSYAIISFVDLKATCYKQDKAKIIVYLTLITISCVIWIASVTVKNMPSPAGPIKQIVFAIMGK